MIPQTVDPVMENNQTGFADCPAGLFTLDTLDQSGPAPDTIGFNDSDGYFTLDTRDGNQTGSTGGQTQSDEQIVTVSGKVNYDGVISGSPCLCLGTRSEWFQSRGGYSARWKWFLHA